MDLVDKIHRDYVLRVCEQGVITWLGTDLEPLKLWEKEDCVYWLIALENCPILVVQYYWDTEPYCWECFALGKVV